MAIHSSAIAWKIPWTEEPDRLQSMESQRVKHKHNLGTEKQQTKDQFQLIFPRASHTVSEYLPEVGTDFYQPFSLFF